MVTAQRGEARSRSLPVPTWVLVGGVFALSFVYRFVYALKDPAPWIFNDELQYSELAKSLAYTGEFAIREVPGTGGFGTLYSALIAPAFVLFESVPDAYDGARAINCLLMSATVIPTYLIARRVAARGWSLAAAAFSVAIPALMLTGTMMTENAFYPLVALWLLTVVRALERPTIATQLAIFAVMGLAFLTRPQAVVLVPVMVATLALVLLLDAWPPEGQAFFIRVWNGTRAYWLTWTIIGLGAIAALARQAMRDRPLSELLGSYGGVTKIGYERDELGMWALYHLAEADIFLGVLPLAAFIAVVIAGLRPAEDRSIRILAALGLTTVGAFLAVVAAYASSPIGDRILERNFFHVTPLFFIALAVWGSRTNVRSWWAVAPAALLAGMLTLALPLNNFLNATIVHSTPGLLPIWRWRDRAFSPESIDEWVAGTAIVAALLFVLLPRRFAPAVVVLLVLYFAAGSRPVEAFTNHASSEAFASALGSPRDWIDRRVGPEADVSSIWTGAPEGLPFWESEFFNRSVGRAYTIQGAWDGLVDTITPVSVRSDGRLIQSSGEPLRLDYAMTYSGTTFRGRSLGRNQAGRMSLVEIDGPVVMEERYEGLFPDRWSGPNFTYTRYDCRRGRLVLSFENTPVHRRRFTVQVYEHGALVSKLRFNPRRQYSKATIPLRPRARRCDIALQIPVASAAGLGGGDLRELGLRFLSIRYEPSR